MDKKNLIIIYQLDKLQMYLQIILITSGYLFYGVPEYISISIYAIKYR